MFFFFPPLPLPLCKGASENRLWVSSFPLHNGKRIQALCTSSVLYLSLQIQGPHPLAPRVCQHFLSKIINTISSGHRARGAARLLMPYIRDGSNATSKADLGVSRQRRTHRVRLNATGRDVVLISAASVSLSSRGQIPHSCICATALYSRGDVGVVAQAVKTRSSLVFLPFHHGIRGIIPRALLPQLRHLERHERNTADCTACGAEDGDSGSLQITWAQPLTLRYHDLTTIKTPDHLICFTSASIWLVNGFCLH